MLWDTTKVLNVCCTSAIHEHFFLLNLKLKPCWHVCESVKICVSDAGKKMGMKLTYLLLLLLKTFKKKQYKNNINIINHLGLQL